MHRFCLLPFSESFLLPSSHGVPIYIGIRRERIRTADPVTMSIPFPYAVPGTRPRPVQREEYHEEHDYGYHLFIINRWLAGC